MSLSLATKGIQGGALSLATKGIIWKRSLFDWLSGFPAFVVTKEAVTRIFEKVSPTRIFDYGDS